MVSVKHTDLYLDVLLELNYDFGDVFILEGLIVISEIKAGVNVSWNLHGKQMAKDLTHFLGEHSKDVIYISNRINSYSVVALDWVKFFKNSYTIKAYYIISDKPNSKFNIMIENLFFNNKIKTFDSLHMAINWSKKGAIY